MNRIFKWKIHWLFGIVLVFLFNFYIFRFQSYAFFRDYIIIPNQKIVQNTYNPLLYLIELSQNWLIERVSPNIISTFTFSSIFALGYIIIFYSLLKLKYLIDQEPKENISKKFDYKKHLLTIITSFVLVYNPFTLERFFMGQDRVILGLFLLVPYLVLLIHYVINQYKKYLLLMLLIAFSLIFINIHALVLALLISIASLIFRMNKKIIIVVFLNLIFVISSLILNFNLLDTNNNKFYIENISNNTGSSLQIVEAFSLKEKNVENLIAKGLTGGASWNTPSFIDVDKITFNLAEVGELSYYISNSWALGFFVYLIINFILALYFLYRSEISKLKLVFITFFPFLLLLFSFGLSLEITKFINQFWYYIPGSYIFREPGKVYFLFFTIILISVFFIIVKTNNKYLKKLNVTLLIIYSISGFLPFTQVSNSLNYLTIPNIFNYALEICNNRKLLYLPDELYITPNWSKSFILNPLSQIKTNDCIIQKPGNVGLASEISTLKLESTVDGMKLESALQKYNSQIPEIKDGVIYVDSQKQKQNIEELLNVLKEQKIDLLLVDSTKTKNGFNLIADLFVHSTLIKQEGDNYLFQL